MAAERENGPKPIACLEECNFVQDCSINYGSFARLGQASFSSDVRFRSTYREVVNTRSFKTFFWEEYMFKLQVKGPSFSHCHSNVTVLGESCGLF